jgi:hypothetical protein
VAKDAPNLLSQLRSARTIRSSEYLNVKRIDELNLKLHDGHGCARDLPALMLRTL